MVDEQQAAGSLSEAFNDFSVKLRDLEEKENLIKDRVLLIGDNLISEKEETENAILDLKNEIAKINDEIRRLKLAAERIIDESNNFARKNEVEILQRQFEMFQPLELARISDVEDMINQALKNRGK